MNISDQGILIEADQPYGKNEPDNFKSGNGNYFVLKDSKNDSVGKTNFSQFQWLVNNQIEPALNSGSYSEVARYLDVLSFVDYYLISEYTANWDCVASSFYMYQDNPSDQIHAGLMWDLDISLGNNNFAQPSMSWVLSTGDIPRRVQLY